MTDISSKTIAPGTTGAHQPEKAAASKLDGVVNLSDQHRCIFIHIPKTAGSSIKEVLGLPGSGHPPWQYFYNIHHEKWCAYKKFTVIRNPWDRAVSAYCYARMKTSYWHNPVSGMHPDYAVLSNRSFDDCIYILKNERELLRHESWHPQTLWLMGTERLSGKLMVDFILTYENLENDFSLLCDKLAIPVKKLPHSNRSDRKAYKGFYKNRTIDLISEIYADDINTFNYAY